MAQLIAASVRQALTASSCSKDATDRCLLCKRMLSCFVAEDKEQALHIQVSTLDQGVLFIALSYARLYLEDSVFAATIICV